MCIGFFWGYFGVLNVLLVIFRVVWGDRLNQFVVFVFFWQGYVTVCWFSLFFGLT